MLEWFTGYSYNFDYNDIGDAAKWSQNIGCPAYQRGSSQSPGSNFNLPLWCFIQPKVGFSSIKGCSSLRKLAAGSPISNLMLYTKQSWNAKLCLQNQPPHKCAEQQPPHSQNCDFAQKSSTFHSLLGCQ